MPLLPLKPPYITTGRGEPAYPTASTASSHGPAVFIAPARGAPGLPMVEPGGEGGQADQLADALNALANSVRIQLLREVRTPKILKDIKVYAPVDAAGDRGRPLSRQSVKDHLDRLTQIGAVVTREIKGERGMTVEYVMNQQQVFRISEEFRSLAKLRAVPSLPLDTVLGEQEQESHQIQGPCLVLVKGIDEGQTFSLEPPDGDKAEWIIGRRRSTHISLEYDPFVSSQNSVIRWRDATYTLEDLPESRNGTTRNFRLMPKGRPTPIRNGDLVGVGRSLLLFYE